MGNGSSQSVMLGGTSYPLRSELPMGHPPKYAHPHNRVLPVPVTSAGHRGLRATDNGNILQTAGTIRGLRKADDGDFYHHNLRNHRLFHSDPNITRHNGYHSGLNSGREMRRGSGGGAASRAQHRLNKYRKKAPAPQPPPGGVSSLPRQLERRSNYQPSRSQNCKCLPMKTRAPQPPDIVVHPPPPPPLPTPSSITRSTDSRASCYEKHVHPLERWRNCRSSGDVRPAENITTSFDNDTGRTTTFDCRMVEGASKKSECLSPRPDDGSRTTVFDSRGVVCSPARPPTHLPLRPDPFQKEIQAVTRKIAQGRTPDQTQKAEAKKPEAAKPKFYFADVDVFRKPPADNKSKDSVVRADGSVEPSRTTVDEIVPCLERFSPARRRVRSPSRLSTPTPTQQKAERGWDDLSRVMQKRSQNQNSDIDIKLRPVLPRKQAEVPKFSPADAWNALGSDGLCSSYHSTSDDNPELVSGFVKKRAISDSRVPDKPGKNAGHWTPRQDLLDDSDVSSDVSEEAVVPRAGLSEIATRFPLPSVMFNNMRPIGSDFATKPGKGSYLNESAKAKHSKKKMAKQPPENGGYSNFGGRLLGSRRSKFQSEDDLMTATASDSNWTFGNQGLQKRGKLYSSELVLSDTKRHALDEDGDLTDFLEDILVSKSNHVRSQMRSSDSGHSNSNFSFYSTEGLVFTPNDPKCPSPPTKGRVYHMRKRFDPNIQTQRGSSKQRGEAQGWTGRDLDLAKAIEDEVRKRRNKEKISIRQQLHKIKSLQVEDDEAYFTEPKSREDSQSPLYRGAAAPSRYQQPLSHWESSPALLEDPAEKINPIFKGRLSAVSSPSPEAWSAHRSSAVDSWLRTSQGTSRGRHKDVDPAEDGDVSSSPTPALGPKKKKKTNIYKQLMDIVRKEERHLKKAQHNGAEPCSSRDSSYSHRESSPSTCSDTSSTSSYSYSDSSGRVKNRAEPRSNSNGVSANREFIRSGTNFKFQQPTFPAAFVQPYAPSKGYRPVPFDAGPQQYRGHRLTEEKHSKIPTRVT